MKRIRAVCTDTNSFCRLNSSFTVDQMAQITLSFKLSPDGDAVHVPLKQLLLSDSRGYYYCVVARTNMMSDVASSLTDFEVVLGSLVMESLFFAYNVSENRIAFANKLVPDSFVPTGVLYNARRVHR